jgi:hypothetical protein
VFSAIMAMMPTAMKTLSMMRAATKPSERTSNRLRRTG